MSDQLDELLAERAIRATMARYCRGIDRCDEDLVRSAYHEESYDNHGIYAGDGHAFAAYVVPMLRDAYLMTQHFLGNSHIELAGDVAAVETYCTAYHLRRGDDGGLFLDVFGCRYVDRFANRGGEWRIAHRTVVHDWDEVREVGDRFPADMRATFEAGRRDRADISYRVLDR